MTTLLIKHAYIVTMDDHQREIPDGGLFVRDGFVEWIGSTDELLDPSSALRQAQGNIEKEADEILDLSGHVLLPGLEHTPSLLPDPDARGPARAGCQPVQLAQDALSYLGPINAG